MPDKTRILVLDDDGAHAEAASESLARSGYDCTVATSGTEGLRLIEKDGFDVVLTDLVMRDHSGIEIVRKVKAASPDTEVIVMTGAIADIEARIGRQDASSFGSIHVQSDDLSAVERAVRQFVPRLPGGSRGSVLAPPRNGWIAVYDDVCDRNPEMLRRLARELSDRMGAVVTLLGVERDELVRMILLEHGRVVDEYLSVPEFYGPLPPGDVVGLAANPTVVSRLTGAAPEEVRRIARTASAPADLPPARDLLAQLAAAMGIEGAGHGWSDAPAIDGAVRIDR